MVEATLQSCRSNFYHVFCAYARLQSSLGAVEYWNAIVHMLKNCGFCAYA